MNIFSIAEAQKFESSIVAFEEFHYLSYFHPKPEEAKKRTSPEFYGVLKNKINLQFGLLTNFVYPPSQEGKPAWQDKGLQMYSFSRIPGSDFVRLTDVSLSCHIFYKMRLANPVELHQLQEGIRSHMFKFTKYEQVIINDEVWKKLNEQSIDHYFNKYKVFQLINLDNSSHVKLPKELILAVLGMALSAE